jgi:hypothetical protein
VATNGEIYARAEFCNGFIVDEPGVLGQELTGMARPRQSLQWLASAFERFGLVEKLVEPFMVVFVMVTLVCHWPCSIK